MTAIDRSGAARACLDAADPATKCALTRHYAELAMQGALVDLDTGAPDPIGEPGRPERPQLVEPRALPQRPLSTQAGRAALVHAVAHIEFNAINLAWDAVYRFRGMPEAFYADWIGVAADEARHFGMLQARLTDMGHAYGDFDAHNGLWDMAVRTAGSCLERMALVPRVLEARGLDVTPPMIAKLRSAGDLDTVAVLEVILREEVAHVAAGSRWFAWCCAREGTETLPTFEALLARHLPAGLRGPFNLEARLLAGFTAEEMQRLGGVAA